jgi:hypothetical protein
MREAYEWFFCPVHGIFGAQNWPLITVLFGSMVASLKFWGADLLRRIRSLPCGPKKPV